MAIHRVLIERNEDVDLVPHVGHRRVTRPDGQEGMPSTNDRLVGVVSVEVESAPREDASENVAGGGDALAVFTAYADREIYLRIFLHLVNRVQSAGSFRQVQATRTPGPRDGQRRLAAAAARPAEWRELRK